MDELLSDFKQESTGLVDQLVEILDEIEEDFLLRVKLEEYGQIVDRIMGGANSLTMAVENNTVVQIGKYAELCKVVGYKGSQIEQDEHFYTIVVALLLDATEMLQQMVVGLGTAQEKSAKDILTDTFLDRLRWIDKRFGQDVRASVEVKEKEDKKSMDQSEIDDLLKQLGVG
jgi:hypothetical protein